MALIEDMEVYKYSYNLSLKIYEITRTFPQDEKYGLVSQMRRAAISVISNLSEGGARLNSGELRQFIAIARGSITELKTQIMISKDLGFIAEQDFNELIKNIESVKKMMNSLIKSISATHHSPLTIHHSPLTTHHSPFTTHHSPKCQN